MEGVLVEEFHRLQMRVELVHDREILLQEILDDIPHRHVVWQSDFVADGDKFAASESKRRDVPFIIRRIDYVLALAHVV